MNSRNSPRHRVDNPDMKPSQVLCNIILIVFSLQGSSAECERFETKVSVSKYPDSDRHSITYNGKVCPIDFKGADDLDAVGCGLNVRDACMERIFLVDTSDSQTGEAGGEHSGEEAGACRTEGGENK